MRRKADLPSKSCRHCGRPMVWRKAWAKNWDDVLYCSERCQREAKAARRSAGTAQAVTKAGGAARLAP